MGTKVNAQQNQQSSYVQSVKDLCRISVERGISPFQRSSLLYPLTPNFYTERKALSVVHSYTNSIITKRREELRQRGANGNTEVEENDIGMKRKSAFLDLLLRSTIDGKPLSQEDIREEVDTFMFEGHDTTASAITFALYSLAANPEVQKLVLEEQVKIFGPDLNPEAVTHTNLQDMHYLELVIKETLRLYPSVPFFFRQTDQEIEYNGRMIPKDLTLAIFPFGMQRDPRFFPDPEKFNPNRFDEIDGKLPYAYVPFSAGPRNCIGQKFAMLEMKSTISKVLRRFELLSAVPNHQLQLAAEAVLKSKNGVRIGIRRR